MVAGTPHHRRSIRLRGHDYGAEGWYFITMVTRHRRPLLATRAGNMLITTAAGRLVEASWYEIPDHFRHVAIDAFVVMPDHLHGIIRLVGNPPRRLQGVRRVYPGSLAAVVRSFKSASTRRINELSGSSSAIWVRNYYERILRDDRALGAVRCYITNNPRVWLGRSRRDSVQSR